MPDDPPTDRHRRNAIRKIGSANPKTVRALAAMKEVPAEAFVPGKEGGGLPTGRNPVVASWSSPPPEGFLPPKGYAPREDDKPLEGYVAHPVVKDGMINGLDQVQGPTVMDYVAARDGVPAKAACKRLEQKLAAGRPAAEGPNGTIDRQRWRYATINVDGSVAFLKPPGAVPWFLMAAAEVLAVWPPLADWVVKGATPNKPLRKIVGTRPKQPDVDATALDLLRQCHAKKTKASIKTVVRPGLRAMTTEPSFKQIQLAIKTAKETLQREASQKNITSRVTENA